MNRSKEVNRSPRLLGLGITRNAVMTTGRVARLGATFIFAAALLMAQAAAAQTPTNPSGSTPASSGASGGSNTTSGSTKTDKPKSGGGKIEVYAFPEPPGDSKVTRVPAAPPERPIVVGHLGGPGFPRTLDGQQVDELGGEHVTIVGHTEPTNPATPTPPGASESKPTPTQPGTSEPKPPTKEPSTKPQPKPEKTPHPGTQAPRGPVIPKRGTSPNKAQHPQPIVPRPQASHHR